MNSPNPYTSPKSPPGAASPPAKIPSVLRDGPYLVVRQRRIELLGNCIACNAARAGQLKLKVGRLSNMLAFLGPAVLIAVLVAPSARLNVGLCEIHLRAERRARGRVRWMLLGGIGLILATFFIDNAMAGNGDQALAWEILAGIVGFGGLALLLAAIAYGVLRSKLLRAIHADRNYIWIDKVHSDYLSQFPQADAAPDPAQIAR